MKKTLTIYTLASMALIAQAQEKKTYTNFADTTFNLQEVVVHTNRKARPQVTKLDVPMK